MAQQLYTFDLNSFRLLGLFFSLLFSFYPSEAQRLDRQPAEVRMAMFQEAERVGQTGSFQFKHNDLDVNYTFPPAQAAQPVEIQRDHRSTPLHPNHPGQETKPLLNIEFSHLDATTLAQLLAVSDPSLLMRIVNFGNAFTIGGAVKSGHGSQEEDLMCVIAGLYQSLCAYGHESSVHWGYHYSENPSENRRLTDDCTTGAYISRNLPIIWNYQTSEPTLPVFVDVVTSAAYDLSCPDSSESGKSKNVASINPNRPEYVGGYLEGMRNRIRTQLYAAANEGIKRGIKPALILGLFGAGAFGNDPITIAQLYADVLDEYAFKGAFDRVIFSLFKGKKNEAFIAKIIEKQLQGTKNTTFNFPQFNHLQAIFISSPLLRNSFALTSPSPISLPLKVTDSKLLRSLFPLAQAILPQRMVSDSRDALAPGSRIRLANREIRRVVEINGDDLLIEGAPIVAQVFSVEAGHETLDLTPVDWTDGGWLHGYSRTQPKFFIPATETNRAAYRAAIGRAGTFANGMSRTITDVEDASPFIHISFEGEALSEAEIRKIVNFTMGIPLFRLPQAALSLSEISSSGTSLPSPGSYVRLANGEIRRVVEVKGGDLLIEGLPIVAQDFSVEAVPEAPDSKPVDWTDAGWLHGYSRTQPKFFIPATETNKTAYRAAIGRLCTFANGQSRTIKDVEDAGPFLYIVFDGDPIDGHATKGPLLIH